MQQIDLGTLSIIQSFPSASNAAIKVFNDKRKSGNILACCEHRQKPLMVMDGYTREIKSLKTYP